MSKIILTGPIDSFWQSHFQKFGSQSADTIREIENLNSFENKIYYLADPDLGLSEFLRRHEPRRFSFDFIL
jgi:hypothetical protein